MESIPNNDFLFELACTDNTSFPYEIKDQLISLQKNEEFLSTVKFSHPRLSPKGDYFAAVGSESSKDTLYMWKYSNLQKHYMHYSEPGKRIIGVEFAPNSNSFVIIFESQLPKHFACATGELIATFVKKDSYTLSKPLSWCFSIKGKYLALATSDRVLTWNVLTGEEKLNLKGSGKLRFIRGSIVVSITDTNKVRLLSLKEGKEITVFAININKEEDVRACMLNPDASLFYYSTDKVVVKLSPLSPTIKEIFEYGEDQPLASFSPDCETVVTWGRERISIWSLSQKKKIKEIVREPFQSMCPHLGQNKIIIVDDISIVIMSVDTEKELKIIWTNEVPKKFDYFMFTPDYKAFMGVSGVASAVLWNTQTGEIIRKFYKSSFDYFAKSIAIVPASKGKNIMATKSGACVSSIWNTITGENLWRKEFPLTFKPYTHTFSKDGSLLAVGNLAGIDSAALIDLDKDEHKYFSSKGQNERTVVNLSPNNHYLIAHSSKSTPKVWNAITGQIIAATYPINTNSCYVLVDEVKCSPDCKTFFSRGFQDHQVPFANVWDIETGEMLTEFPNCQSIEYSADGKNLLVKIESEVLLFYNFENKNFVRTKLDSPLNSFLQDGKIAISLFENSEGGVDYVFTNVVTGMVVAELKYVEKTQGNTDADIGLIVGTNTVYFKRIKVIESS